ncbi:MAG: hypothetical protein ABIM30_00290 [candidate division WOR-3 bacterium]
MQNLKTAAVLGMISSLEKNNIVSSDLPEIEKVASYFIENVDFDPTSPTDLEKVAVAMISMLDKVAQSVGKPDNTLENDQTFAALLEKARTERNNVIKGLSGVGQSELDDKGLIGALLNAQRGNLPGAKDNTLDADQTFAALLEKARKERESVNKGRWGAGVSELADKGIIGEEKKASDNVSLDDLIKYLQS